MNTPSSGPSANGYRGYEALNTVIRNGSIALLHNLHVAELLAMGGQWDGKAPEIKEPRYLQAAVDFLISQGVLEYIEENKLRATAEGRGILDNAAITAECNKTLIKITLILKRALDWEDGEDCVERKNHTDSENLTPAAITYLHEAMTTENITASEILQQGKELELRSIVGNGNHSKEIKMFMKALASMDLIELTERGYAATDRGKKVLSLGGYAELIVSYYEMIHELYYLLTGEVRYGLDADIFRDAKLNAHASNGILDLRVAPFIVDTILEGKIKSDDARLVERLKKADAIVDYGSGGGDMLIRAAKVGHLIGIDVNPGANSAAGEVLKSKGLSGKSQLITGSIADDDAIALWTAKEKMETKGVKNPVATINFILHDIGPNLSRQFLANHAKVFGNTPLIITETFRMSTEVLKAHPNHQAASFQFMHKASGQNLYTEDELKALLESCGYKVTYQQSHSSMPNADSSGRLTTIATWIVQFEGKLQA